MTLKLKIKILLIHTGGIGDLIMARPTIQYVRRKYPFAQIDFLGNPASLEILSKDPWIQSLIPFPSSTKNLLSIFSVMRVLLKLRFRKYDYNYLLQPVLGKDSHHRLRFLVNFIAANKSFGRRSPFGKDFLYQSVDENLLLHEVERMLSFFSTDGFLQVSKRNYLLPVSDWTLKDIYNFEKKAFAVIGPGGTKPYRRWPIENFLNLANRFIQLGLMVIFIGGVNETNILQGKLEKLPKRSINLIGRTNLSQLCSLVSKSKIVVANDSGPMHLANALNLPVVGIFGSGDAKRTRPYLENKSRVVDSPSIDCKPCYKEICAAPECMEAITVDKVWQAVLELLKGV